MSVSPQALPVAAARGMPPATVVLVLSLLLGIQPVTTDLYLPALPSLTESFRASTAQAQLSLTALLLAFGTSQLVWGPLSDRFGRRPVLLWGLALYTAAAAACTAAASMEQFLVARTVQGAAMGAAVMGARALVRDLYDPQAGARAMSRGLSGLGVLACLGPALGGVLADAFGWRAALATTALFGCAAFAVIALRFEETLARRNPRALSPGELATAWLRIVRHPTFLAYSALATASYAGLFVYLASSSFVFIRVLGYSRTAYGLVMLSTAFVYIVGTILCRRLLPRFGLRRTVAVAAALTLTGGTVMGVLGMLGVQSGPAILAPFYLFMLAHGVHQPCGQSGAVGPFPQAAGAASALNGFLMMVVAFAVGGWVGPHLDGTARVLTDGVWAASAAIALTAWTLVQRYGEPR